MIKKSVTISFAAAAAMCMCVSVHAQNLIDTFTVSGSAGSFITGSTSSSGPKQDGNITTISTTTSKNRGWAVFDLSTAPQGAVLVSAKVVFTTYSSTSSTAANKLLGFISDPATETAGNLYSQIQAGVEFNSSSWTANAVNTKPVNANGLAFIQSHLGDTMVLGFLRGSTNEYNIYGYPGTAAQKPLLILEYSTIPCSGKPDPGIAIADATTLCPGYPLMITDTGHSRNDAVTYGLSWVWQQSLDSLTWGDIPGTQGKDTFQTIVAIKTFYRMKVICANTFDTSYSNIIAINIPPAYACYCFSRANGVDDDTSDIGGFTIGKYSVTDGGSHLQNPKAVNGNTNRYVDGIIKLHPDSTYGFELYHTMSSKVHRDARITIFIDFNGNNQYDLPEERVYTGKSSISDFYVKDKITIPQQVVLEQPVGMRVILNNNTNPNVESDEGCGVYPSGETEDFVVLFSMPFPAGVQSISGAHSFEVYPNPTTGRFTINMAKGSYEKLAITVTDIRGQKVFAETYSTGKAFKQEINLEDKASGMYLIEINADGERMVQKMVKR